MLKKGGENRILLVRAQQVQRLPDNDRRRHHAAIPAPDDRGCAVGELRPATQRCNCTSCHSSTTGNWRFSYITWYSKIRVISPLPPHPAPVFATFTVPWTTFARVTVASTIFAIAPMVANLITRSPYRASYNMKLYHLSYILGCLLCSSRPRHPSHTAVVVRRSRFHPAGIPFEVRFGDQAKSEKMASSPTQMMQVNVNSQNSRQVRLEPFQDAGWCHHLLASRFPVSISRRPTHSQ